MPFEDYHSLNPIMRVSRLGPRLTGQGRDREEWDHESTRAKRAKCDETGQGS